MPAICCYMAETAGGQTHICCAQCLNRVAGLLQSPTKCQGTFGPARTAGSTGSKRLVSLAKVSPVAAQPKALVFGHLGTLCFVCMHR